MRDNEALLHLRVGDVSESFCSEKCVLNKMYLDRDTVKFWAREKNSGAVVFDVYDPREDNAVKVDGNEYFWKMSSYINSLKFYEGTVATLKEKGIRKVTIICGSQYP